MKTRRLVPLLATILAAQPVQAAPSDRDPKAELTAIDTIFDGNFPAIKSLYEDIHQHPEVGFREERTAALLAEHMRQLGFTVTEKIGGTGIVAIYENGDGPTVLVRTELDGLPMEEKTGLSYASRYTQDVDGKATPTMHACGHDIHMAWWVSTAQTLLAMKDEWRGTLMFIGQPAEEILSGASAMLDDGLFTRFPKPDYGFAAHVMPGPVGLVTFKEGVSTSAADNLKITFHGKGAHGSMPSAGIDPIVMGAHFVSDVQSIRGREVDPGAFGVITVGSFQSGFAPNIIPDSSQLLLTLRSHDPDVRQQLLDGVKRTAMAAAAMAKAPEPTIEYLNGASAVSNDVALTGAIAAVLKQAKGDGVVLEPEYKPAGSASEDYSEIVAAGVPSVFMGIGGIPPETLAKYKAEGKPVPVNHSPFFAPDPEGAIRSGTEALTLAVLSVAGIEP